MKKRKTKAEKIMEAMIDRAIYKAIDRIPIPIMEVLTISRIAKNYAFAGADEAGVTAAVAAYVERFKMKEIA